MLNETPTFMNASCAIGSSVSGCNDWVERGRMAQPPGTLADLLRRGLQVVFVGINPSLYSVAQGHYFARRSNRFWPCFSGSTLSARVRRALRVDTLDPEHDQFLPDHGFGFTDLCKRATA